MIGQTRHDLNPRSLDHEAWALPQCNDKRSATNVLERSSAKEKHIAATDLQDVGALVDLLLNGGDDGVDAAHLELDARLVHASEPREKRSKIVKESKTLALKIPNFQPMPDISKIRAFRVTVFRAVQIKRRHLSALPHNKPPTRLFDVGLSSFVLSSFALFT